MNRRPHKRCLSLKERKGGNRGIRHQAVWFRNGLEVQQEQRSFDKPSEYAESNQGGSYIVWAPIYQDLKLMRMLQQDDPSEGHSFHDQGKGGKTPESEVSRACARARLLAKLAKMGYQQENLILRYPSTVQYWS